MAQYALVRFVEDDKLKIVPVTDIKKFEKNFKSDKKYSVRWENDDFYDATIVVVKEKVEEVKDFLERSKRIPILRKDLLESASEDSDADLAKINSNLIPFDPNKRKKKNFKPPPAYNQKLDNQLIQLHEANDALKTFNASEIDEVINSKIQVSTLNKQTQTFNNNNNGEMEELKKKIENLEKEIEQMRLLNYSLQETVIKHFEKVVKSPDEDKNLEIAQVVGNQVHLGRGIFIDKAAFNNAWFISSSNAQFVKNIAMSVFGVDTLKSSSVTGKSSNRSKGPPKNPLGGTELAAIEDVYRYYLIKKGTSSEDLITREIKMIRTYIASKISDLKKPSRKKAAEGSTTIIDETCETEEDSTSKENEDSNMVGQ